MEMMYLDDSLFEMNVEDIKTRRRLIAFSGIFVASMVILHRVNKDHSLFDSLTGMLIGGCIGFISWTTLDFLRNIIQCEIMGPNAKECESQ